MQAISSIRRFATAASLLVAGLAAAQTTTAPGATPPCPGPLVGSAAMGAAAPPGQLAQPGGGLGNATDPGGAMPGSTSPGSAPSTGGSTAIGSRPLTDLTPRGNDVPSGPIQPGGTASTDTMPGSGAMGAPPAGTTSPSASGCR